MRPVTHQNLGIVIAYLLPGFAALAAIGLHSELIRSWLGASSTDAPTVGGFLYVTIGSLGLGVLLNCIRILLLDPILHWSGVSKHRWNYSRLQANITAVEFVLAYQYRYFQFSGNMLSALLVAFPCVAVSFPGRWPWLTLGFVSLGVTLFLSSRRLLKTYYSRMDEILGVVKPGSDEPFHPIEATSLLPKTVDRAGHLGYDF